MYNDLGNRISNAVLTLLIVAVIVSLSVGGLVGYFLLR